jgi:hypothetical protein
VSTGNDRRRARTPLLAAAARPAVSHAKRHLDVRFFWDLVRVLPTAEAAAGDLDEAENDVMRLSAHVDDVTESGEGEVADLLRPFYLDYLRRHDIAAP